MTRKMLTASMAVLALLLSVLTIGAISSTDADAQGTALCPYNVLTETGGTYTWYYYGYDGSYTETTYSYPCNKAFADPGPYTNMPRGPVGPYGFWAPSAVAAAPAPAADADAGTGGGDAAAPLAHTGSESTVLGYVGTGLIAFGAVALGSRRKFFQGALD